MRNTIVIDGYSAVVSFDPEIEMFRGEFVGINGGADFYARDVGALRSEGATSLKVFLEMCAEKGIEPRKAFSGKLNLRLSPELHAQAAMAAAAEGKSLNQWIADALRQASPHH